MYYPSYYNYKCIIDFKEKLVFFPRSGSQSINKPSKLPTYSSRKPRKYLSTIPFIEDDIIKIIKNLDPGKLTSLI